jgi:hypothetical protein
VTRAPQAGAIDGYEMNVFVNCPFDDKYLPLLRPLLFTISYLGYCPRISSERSDSGSNRIEKILRAEGVPQEDVKEDIARMAITEYLKCVADWVRNSDPTR